jgi:hypothetical protein
MMNLRFLLAICILISPTSAFCQEGISFDKLSDCSGLATIKAHLDGALSLSCRPPRGQLETKIMSRVATLQGTRVCLLSNPPTPRLTNFSCVDQVFPGGRELTCFRGVDKIILRDYADKYDSVYRTAAVKYLDASAHCALANGDAAAAPSSLFPPILDSVAKPRFGFYLGMGKELVSHTRAYHGYADVDPDIEGRLGAIEIVDLLKVDQSVSNPVIPNPTNIPKGISLTIDDSPGTRRTLVQTFENQLKRPAVAKVRLVDFKYGGPQNISLTKRQRDLDDWQDGVANILQRAGFRDVTQSDLEGSPFTTPDDMREWIIRNSPFSQQDKDRRMLGPHLVLLVSDEVASCFQVAEVMVKEPEEGVRVDYGGIVIMLLGVGNCHAAEGVSGTLSNELLNKATQYLSSEAKSR